MRNIDRWVGIPLCAIISPFCWFSDLVRGAKRKKPNLKRTLFIELSEMGSAILVDPAMRKLHHQGQAEIYFAIFRKNYKSLAILQTVPDDHIFKMKSDSFFSLIGDIFRFMVWCRKRKISTVIDLELFSRFTALLSFFSGARSRIGFTNFHDEGLYRGNLINRKVRYNPHVHIAINFISLVNKALDLFHNPYSTTPIAASEIQLAKAQVLPDAINNIENKIRQLYPVWNGEVIVLFNVNASDMLPQRRWPQENFVAVAQQLLVKYEQILIIATGSPEEREYVDDVVKQISHARCVNSAGFFLFEELVPLYSRSRMMLTNDSGPAHFASVTPLKVYVLFGPETPHLYLPLGNAEAVYLGLPCSPCVSAANHRKTTCITRPCITGIDPVIVLEKISSYLGAKGVS